MGLRNKHILTIDDTASIRTFLRISLQAQGATVYEASTAEEGERLCEEIKPDLIVLDLGLPDKDGLDILPLLKKKNADNKTAAVVVLTVRKESDTRQQALALGADAYITKPFLMEELMEVIDEKLERH